ncbi:MAG: DUF4350 domain-containing protein [Novosphingobium sp.]
MSAPGAIPFSPRAALALIAFGAVVFVALLYMIGSGAGGGSTNDGGGHAGGKGLNGYAAFAGFLERRGYAVRRVHSEGGLDDPGLLVLTPPALADGAEIDRIVAARRRVGPTLVIAPKWAAVAAPRDAKDARRGWVKLAGTQPPVWRGFLDDVGVRLGPAGGVRLGPAGGVRLGPAGGVRLGPAGDGRRADWSGAGIAGALPDAARVQSGSGARLVPLVVGGRDGRILAAYVADGGSYPALEVMARRPVSPGDPAGNGNGRHAIVLVFEPDLLDNYGMASLPNALLAERLVHAAAGGARVVHFDLTLNGFARAPNLLTLAFTPPFLAATLCLLLAALAVGWRAFLRFGPPRAGARAIAFGKRALVANAAGLIRRSRRLHLVTAPYAARARGRLARALALPRLADVAATEAAIDRALAARDPGAAPFSVIAARLRGAHSPHDIVRAAQDLHALERTLTR